MKRFVLTILILTGLILTGCGGEEAVTEAEPQVVTSTEAVPSTSENTGDQPVPQADGQMEMANREVSELSKLLVGLFKLENTDLALTTDQASALITILNAYMESSQNQNINSEPQVSTPDQSSDDVQNQQAGLQTQQEDLIAQIEAVLTADQLNSVSTLELDQDSLTAFLEEQGISDGGDGQPGRNSDQAMPQGTPSADQSGNVPQVQETPGDGGGNGGPGGNQQGDGSAPDAQFTPGADKGGGQPGQGGGFGGSGSTSHVLIEALLQLLESKVSA